jgi:hypothetical protein
MQFDRQFVIITILVLVLLSILCLTVRSLYLKNPSSEPADSSASPPEIRTVTENKEWGRVSTLFIMDLQRTPAQTQRALSFLLLIPIGLLITALAKTLIGLQTIGTFSPTLLALSQARSDWRIGTVIFIATFGLGTLCRILLARYKLSIVPRRGVVGTVVVLAIVVWISLSNKYGLAPTASHVLLPVAVMTVMIERFFVIMEKDGNRTALKVLANSIAVAALCFVIFEYTRTGRFLLRFPELQLLIIAVLILIGRYSGPSLLAVLGLQPAPNLEQKETE